ncbi:MAG: S8 family serine peptidase [Thermodesulfobacteriota bacterium]|nr:S8 family serine peptidase [Thermodesulfobacteriota bacterium]
MKRIVLISLLVSLTSFAFGQEIQFKTGNTIRTIQQWNVEKVKESIAESESSMIASTQFSEETDYYWIAFKDVINNAIKAKLDFLGVEIIGYAGTFPEGRLYKINVNGRYQDVFDLLKQEETFINLIPVWVEEKIDKNILENRNLTYVDSVLKTIKATIYFYKPMEKEKIEHLLGNSVDTIIFDDADEKVVHIVSTRDELLRIAEIDHVKRVSEYQEKLPLHSHARELTKVNKLQEEFITITHPPTTDWLADVPYTGDGIWICINEGIDPSHLDFHEGLPGGGTQLRKSHPDETWYSADHGTHVAGVAAGNGWNSHLASLIPGGMLQWRGVAPKALLSSTGEKGDINNHSFIESSCGYYNYSPADERLSNHEGTGPIDNNIWIWSAANNGVSAQHGVQRGYYSMLVNSKNAIKVGATNKDMALKAEWSSMGPTRDGRIGPDICAPGDGLGEHESWDIQIDYIAIENNGTTKHRWDFDSGHPEWGTEKWRIDNLVQNDGILSFSTSHGGYFSSNDLISPPFQSEDDDELVFYWKVIQTSSAYSIETMKCVIYWKRPDDSYYKRDDPYATVAFTFQRTGDWQETRIPLDDPRWDITDGGWVDGDDIEKLRLDFQSASPHSMGLVSCYHGTNDYVSWNGTSMSGPHVAGICALMLQKYRDEVLVPLGRGLNIHDNPFWNSTAKAILIHTATDLVSTAGEGFILSNNPDFASQGFHQPEIYGPGPDFATGYGLVNAVKALEYVDTDKFVEDTIDQYETKSYLFSVPPGTKNFRITLAWDDPPYVGDNSESGAYNIKLVNDIDLCLINVNSGEIIRPWVLDHRMLNDRTVPDDGLDPITPCDISDNPAYKGIDNRNNVEVVDVVEWPDVGLWAIVVKGAKIALDQSSAPGINQDISLVLDFSIFTIPPITATVQGSQTPEVKYPPFTGDPMVINGGFTITPDGFDPGHTRPLILFL